MLSAPSDATRKRAAWLDRLEAQAGAAHKKTRTDREGAGGGERGGAEEEKEYKREHDDGVVAIHTETATHPMHSDATDSDAASSSSAAALSPASASSSSTAAVTASSSSSSAAAMPALSFSAPLLIKDEPDAFSSSLATLSSHAAAPPAAAAAFSSPASSAFTPSSTAFSSSSSSSSAFAPSSAASSSSSLSSVASLSAMGFEERVVVESLKRSGGNVEAALEMMLAGVIDAKPVAKSSSAVSASLGSMLRSPERPFAAAAAAGASPNDPTRAMPTLGTVRFGSDGWITWKPSGSGSGVCTCRAKNKPSGGSNIVTLSSLSAAAAATSSCAVCSLASLAPLPSTLAQLRFNPEDHFRANFDSFVALYRPSQIRYEQCAWIVVRMPGDEDADSKWFHTFGMERLQAEWSKSAVKNAATIKALAIRSGYVSGKWLVRSASSVDAVWRSVTSAIVAGLLPGVTTAKVSPLNPTGGDPTHMLCIYTRDWTDEADVMRVRELLRVHCNLHWKLHYKADIYTTLDIYAKNPFKIKATVYTA